MPLAHTASPPLPHSKPSQPLLAQLMRTAASNAPYPCQGVHPDPDAVKSVLYTLQDVRILWMRHWDVAASPLHVTVKNLAREYTFDPLNPVS